MRITKEPEERKQEIFDAALKLFGEKAMKKLQLRISQKRSEWHRDCAIVTFHPKKYCLTAPSISMPTYWWLNLLT